MGKPYSIGIDLGGTKIKIAVIDSTGALLHEITRPTHYNPHEIEHHIVETVHSLQHRVAEPLVAVGVGVAGQVEKNTGVVIFAPNLQWRNIPLKSHLENALQLPVAVTNDVRAATLAEWKCGAGKGATDLVCLLIGTGVGGGIVSQGHLVEGKGNSAGELGHMVLSLDGRRCTCGHSGCLETFISGWALAQEAQEKITLRPEAGQAILSAGEGKITARAIKAAAQQGDPLACSILKGFGRALIAGLVTIANTLNPEKIVLGGGVMMGLDPLISGILEQVQKRALTSAAKDLVIVPAALRENSGVIGAGLYGSFHKI